MPLIFSWAAPIFPLPDPSGRRSAMDLTAKDCDLSVGVRILDCDHRVLFDAISEIQAAAAKNESRRRTGALLRRLAGFTLTHFELEEEMMAAPGYPGLIRHRLEHQRVMEQMKTLISRHIGRALPLARDSARDSLSILSKLHATHVQDGDLRYGLWLNEAFKG
jgi:hemerythrin